MRTMTRYVVLMYGDEGVWERADEAGRAETIAAHDRFSQVVRDHPALSFAGGEALRTADTATTVRREGGRPVVTDGPFAETTEQLGGFYLLDAPDLDAVLAAIQELPAYYVLEVRPVDDSV